MLLAFVFTCGMMMAQSTISGKIMDSKSNEPLIGASVMVKGSTIGTITDYDGSFKLGNVPDGSQTLVVSYLGYNDMSYDVAANGQMMDLGAIMMKGNANMLNEVVVTGVMDIVQDRRTPVAVSTISLQEIQAKSGNVEFPEMMKNTPSIYVAGQAGGFGDSEVFTRGFDQTNTAFLLNGQPINGMEDGKMYWSNWSGMSDVATAVQVQRGLGSSKLAISSVGGTTNIIMKSTAEEAGGSASFMVGNDNYMKGLISYNTGLINDKFGMSFLVSHWQGDGWAEGTRGQGQSYFLSAGYKINDKNNLNFLITGAPQWHDQNYNKRISQFYNDPNNPDEINLRFNNNFGYGYPGGDYFSLRRNFYHKPVANLNWEYNINEKSSLSTVLYGSWGRGGGSGNIGSSANRTYTEDGYFDWATISSLNAQSEPTDVYVIRNSVNNHAWYGAVSTYDTQLSESLGWSIGADLRTYHGSHFRELRDLMGASAYSQRENARFGERLVTQTYDAQPWAALTNFADLEDQIAYSNDETINYGGVFSQLEYTTSNFSAFVQGALSNQTHVRFELFNETEANEESEKVSNLGYNVKTGASYSFDASNTVFFNTGYYQRQPFHDNIYLNFSNFVNPVTVPEKIFGLEFGYKYTSPKFSADLNLYRTSWKDRATTNTLDEGDELPNGLIADGEWFQNNIQNQLHSGIELDFGYKVTSDIKVKGFASIGDWVYEGTIDSKYYDDDRNLVLEQEGASVDGIKVGGGAQTSFGLGLDYNITKDLTFNANYNYYAGNYARPRDVTQTLELPDFGILDLGASYNIGLANDQLLTLRANVFNALGEEYISRATSADAADADDANNWNGINKSNFVTFGQTLTWNVSAKYSF